MAPKQRRAYWDASVFLALFSKGDSPEKQYQREQAIKLLEEVQDSHSFIVTSALTLAESRRGEGVPPLPGDEYATLKAFFKHGYIEVVPVDRAIGELAQEYGERFGLRPPDAVQLATAVRAGADVFLAWDQHFHRKDKMADAPIRIEEPQWRGKERLPGIDDEIQEQQATFEHQNHKRPQL